MHESRVEFRRFHHVTIAVTDLGARRRRLDRTPRLEPSATSSDRTRFPLEDAYVELIGAGSSGLRPGVASVSVVVDNVAEVNARLEAVGSRSTVPLVVARGSIHQR